jgi:Clp amino terminal domain, pathogenicity island component
MYVDLMGAAASSEVTEVAAATGSQDPEVGLAAVAALRGLVEVLEAPPGGERPRQGLVVAADRRQAGGHQAGGPQEVRRPAVRVQEIAKVVQHNEQASRVLELAKQEADRLGHRYVGPEHLVLGVLAEDHNGAARVLGAQGVDLPAARSALGRLAERGLVPGPRPSDAELLRTLGIDLAAIGRITEQTFGGKAVGWAIREATRARRRGVGRVPRTPLEAPPLLLGQALYHAGEQARALGVGVVGPELLLLGVVTDIRTPRPRCMDNRWRRRLHASVGLPRGYRGAAGPLLAALGADVDRLRDAVAVELGGVPR